MHLPQMPWRESSSESGMPNSCLPSMMRPMLSSCGLEASGPSCYENETHLTSGVRSVVSTLRSSSPVTLGISRALYLKLSIRTANYVVHFWGVSVSRVP